MQRLDAKLLPDLILKPHLSSQITFQKAYLYLEDGTVLQGNGFGSKGVRKGELVFTTAMNGYPESLTDPSYFGQILVITHPLVGNYGVPRPLYKKGILSNFESEHIKIEGLAVSEVTYGNAWNSKHSLGAWLLEEGVPGISGIDTRMLTKKVREEGATAAVISNGHALSERLLERLFRERYDSINFVESASVRKPVVYSGRSRKSIALIDFGVKHGILEELAKLGYTIVRLPYNTEPDKVISYEPIGIVYSNGPGNPALFESSIKNFSELLAYKLPTLGICLGHQIAAMAHGARVTKMKFGHRAVNKAVIDMITRKGYITTHNHGYALYADEIPEGSKLWFLSPDDNVVEGLIYESERLITVQFHPEARPGTNDTNFVFRKFSRMIV